MNTALIEQLQSDYPEFRFLKGAKFLFRPPRTIYYMPDAVEYGDLLLMHELGHAVLHHRDFRTNAERVKMERAAWEKARELCKLYGVEFRDDVAQGELDSYRDWLHQKSRCPKCGLTRFQTPDGVYHCPKCDLF